MEKDKRVKKTTVKKQPETTPSIPSRSEEDRRARQAARLASVLRLQELLLGRGKWNVKSLAAELECSEKTVHRYLNVLEMAGVPYHYDAREKSYRVRPGFKFPVVNLTPDEIIGQAAATVVTKAVGLSEGATAAPATRKIAATSPQEVADLLADAETVMKVLDLKLADHSKHQEVIRTIQWALIEGKQVAGQYSSPYQEKPVKLTLHPYRLCLAGHAWYLIARSTEATQPKTYRVARFQSLRMIDASAQRPSDFDLDEYFGNAWGVYRGQDAFDVELEFTKEVATLVTETCWHKTQRIKRHPDGRITLSFRVDGLDEIVPWVVSWAGGVRVLAPERLRSLVVEKLKQAVAMNGG